MDANSKEKPLHENLDTTFVNLWSLLRSLTQKNFVGRVHVELPDYAADILMDGARTPMVREVDRAAGTETIEEAGLHRVVLRARETPGTITVFEGANETIAPHPDGSNAGAISSPTLSPEPAPKVPVAVPKPVDAESVPESAPTQQVAQATRGSVPSVPRVEAAAERGEDLYRTGSYQDWPAILESSSELIAAIERGINATGAQFDRLFDAVRLELADDYSFLDPITRTFAYADGVASMGSKPPVNVFVSGLSEALRRTVDQAAVGDRVRRVRERVALEMLTVARKRSEVLDRSGFGAQLDRIAGTRVK